MHWKKAILFAFLLLFSFSCQSGSQKKISQEIRLNIHSEPPTLDPRTAIDSVSIFVIKQCQEGLMQRGHDGKPIPGIAERYTVSDDGKTYIFYLREAKWSNGKPLTAHDFERSWKTLLDPSFASEQAFELYILKNARAIKNNALPESALGVHALDERTLQVELEHPAPYFLSQITIHPFFPIPDPFNPRVSSGPFRLTEWRHFDELTLKKNTAYWDAAKVRLDTVHLFIIEDDQTELSLFENGELDWAGHPFTSLPTDSLEELRKRETIYRMPMDATYDYVFNTTVFPLNNANIRKALTLAINRQAIVDNITQNGQIPTSSLVPPTMWPEKSEPYFEENLEQARALFQKGLEELGTTLEKLPPLSISYNTMVGHHKIAQAIQQQWNTAFGLKVKLENKDWKVFLDDCNRGNFHIARSGNSANIDDPITFLDTFRYPNAHSNWPKWNSPAYIDLVNKAQMCKDQKERLTLLKQAESIMMDEMPLAPIYIYMGNYIRKPYVKNVYISNLGEMDIKYAYIEND